MHTIAAVLLALTATVTSPRYWEYARQCVQFKEVLECREAEAKPNEACWCVVEYPDGVPTPFCQCKAPVEMTDTEYFEYLIYWGADEEENI